MALNHSIFATFGINLVVFDNLSRPKTRETDVTANAKNNTPRMLTE